MRDITHFLLATLLSLATLACRHDTPPADGSLSRQLPPDTKEILRQLNDRDNREEALRLADSLAALPPSDDPWLEIRIAQAVANTLYKFRRDPSDAIRVQERALAVYRLHRGFVYTFADLSSTYSDLGLYDKAMEAISRSIDYSLQLDSFTISDLYRMKAGIFWELEQHDSTLYYARQALKRGEELKENAYVLAAKNILYNYYYEYVPDSIPAALEGYKELIEEEEAISAGYQDLFKFMLGACLVRDGKPEKGFPLMEEAYALYKKYEANDMMDWTGRHLLNLYAQQKKGDKMAEIYPEYKEIHDSLQLAEKQRYAIGANVRYETGRKEQENRVLSAEVALKERSLVYTRVILILAICLLTGIIVYALQRRRLHQREREIQRQRLDNLLATQQELNRRNERLSAELEQAAHNEVIDSVRQKLNPSLLSGEDELRFRQSFAALYPRFLPGLRKDFPELTKSDELLCMLIYLKQSTDEISLALGISRPSVNSGRSRIRKKLGLQKEESLDEFLQKR